VKLTGIVALATALVVLLTTIAIADSSRRTAAQAERGQSRMQAADNNKGREEWPVPLVWEDTKSGTTCYTIFQGISCVPAAAPRASSSRGDPR
jgi:hypothetical protein